MKVKDVVTSFSDYKETGLLVAFPTCSFKCCKEYGGCTNDMCQNSELARQESVEITKEKIIGRFNPDIHKALIFGGLEPIDSYYDMMMLAFMFREKYAYPIVIYTGYTEKEVKELQSKMHFDDIGNVIVKYGRYIPNMESHYDKVLGVELASPNQYAIKYGGR